MTRRIELLCENVDSPRLDAFVAKAVEELSRERVIGLIEEGRVTVNGKSVRKSTRLFPQDRIVVEIPPPIPIDCQAEEIPLVVLYEDDHLLVVNKPRGMLTHPVGRHVTGTLVNALLGHCRFLSGIGGALRPGIVHRLDRETSGLLVVAKSDEAHQGLCSQFKARTVEKTYLAVVSGELKHPLGSIELPIGRDLASHGRRKVDLQRGKAARTDYRVVRRVGSLTLLEIRLHTGRTHQIRVHLSYLGHPLVGDRTYGWRGGVPFAGVALHSHRLAFRHPVTGKRLEFESPLPDDLRELLGES